MKAAFEEEAADTGNTQLLLTAAVAARKDSIDTAYQIDVIAQWVQFYKNEQSRKKLTNK